MRRIDGSVDFNRYWSEYEEGFGNLPDNDKDTTGEFWIGLRSLHCLTSHGQWELCIDYMLSNKTKGYLSYHHFRVGPASDDYQLSISDGNTTDPITGSHSLNNMKFTTRDRDNDKVESIVQYIIQVVMLVDGGTIIVPTYFPIISTITGIQYFLMALGIPFLLLK